MPASRKRLICRVVVCLLLGAMTSIAVAWGCAWRFGAAGWFSGSRQLIVAKSAGAFAWDGDPATIIGYYRYRGFGATYLSPPGVLKQASTAEKRTTGAFPYWSALAGRSGAEIRDINGLRSEIAVGFPFRTLTHDFDPVQWTVTGAYFYGATPLNPTGRAVLPYRPIYPGLIANTAIYGTMWWLLLFGPGIFIRWRRRRKGLCLKCGYDLRGSESASVCPECGAGAIR